MSQYLPNRVALVQYVNAILMDFEHDSALTTTITVEKSGGFYVLTVTGASSEDTVKNLAAWPYLEPRQNT
jgi:hypothetical protein